jgi:hypothetical protein
MPILNYTTKIDPAKSVLEIQRELSKRADSVSVEYTSGQPVAVRFTITVAGQSVLFRLPCNAKGVLKALNSQRGVPGTYRNLMHAERVAWRIVKDWIEAQMAIVEAGQAEMAEVFLPYATTDDGTQTMYGAFQRMQERKLITAGDDAQLTEK